MSPLIGNVTEVIFEQLRNALTPILVTDDGITTEVRLELLENAEDPILVTSNIIPDLVNVLGIDIAPDAVGDDPTDACVTQKL